MFADVRRGLTVAAVVRGATVTDTDGNVIDTTEFFGPIGTQAEARRRDAEPKPTRRSRSRDADDADEETADAQVTL